MLDYVRVINFRIIIIINKKDTHCCSWKSGKVKTAYKNGYVHANVGLDLFDTRVCAAAVLRFVAIVFMFSSLRHH